MMDGTYVATQTQHLSEYLHAKITATESDIERTRGGYYRFGALYLVAAMATIQVWLWRVMKTDDPRIESTPNVVVNVLPVVAVGCLIAVGTAMNRRWRRLRLLEGRLDAFTEIKAEQAGPDHGGSRSHAGSASLGAARTH